MKVLFITNVPSPYRVDFFNEIGKYVDLTVLFERNNAKSRNDEWMSNNFKNFKYHFLKGIEYGDDAVISFEVKKYLKDKYDIVLFGNYHTINSVISSRYCIKHKIPYGLSIDGIFKHENENKFKLKLKRKMFSNSEFLVTTGDYSVDVNKYYGGMNNYIYPFTSIHSSYVIDKPITIEEKTKLKEKLGLKKKTILFVGQFVHRKGIDLLFQIYSKLEEYELVMIGGNLNDEYLKLKESLGLNIKTISFLDKKSLEGYYLASDVFLLPTREDQWGLVINEALAKGLPVVSSNMCLACHEMLAGCGEMVDVLDIDKYVDCIKNILTLPYDKYYEMQANAINISKEYTIEKMAKRHLEIFEDVISKR